MTKSNLIVPTRGVVELVGGHDTGKTIAALQAAYPYTKSIFVDDDTKGSGMVQQMNVAEMNLERYVDLGRMRTSIGKTPTPDQLLNEVVLPLVEEIVKTKHDLIIWDTWRTVYQAARGHVDRNQSSYRDVVKFQGSSQIIQGLVSRVARQIEAKIIDDLRESCQLLIITHHLKAWYEENVVVGQIPESSRTFSEVCNMRIWLQRNPASKVPTMLFLKRPSVPRVEKGRPVFTNVVPMKIVPNDKDQSIWDAIERYYKDPIESRLPTVEETPNAEELAMMAGVMSGEQRRFVMEVLKHQKGEEKEAQSIASQIVTPSQDTDYVPGTASELFVSALKIWGMTGADINSTVGHGVDAIMGMSETELSNVWKALLKANQ